jgi:hypothetical protein
MNKYLIVGVFLLFVVFNIQAQDKFAEIGTRQYQTRENLLTVPKPPVLPGKYLPVTNRKDAAFEKKDPMASSKELYAELDKFNISSFAKAGEKTAFEAWVCNDLNKVSEGYVLKYQVGKNGKVVFANQVDADIPENSKVR